MLDHHRKTVTLKREQARQREAESEGEEARHREADRGRQRAREKNARQREAESEGEEGEDAGPPPQDRHSQAITGTFKNNHLAEM